MAGGANLCVSGPAVCAAHARAPCTRASWDAGASRGAGRHEAEAATYVLERDDVRVLAVPQEDLDLFRGVAFALIDDLEQTGAVRPWLGLCPPLQLAAAEGPAVSRMLAAARCARLHRPPSPVPAGTGPRSPPRGGRLTPLLPHPWGRTGRGGGGQAPH